MQLSEGLGAVLVGILDGSIDKEHPALSRARILEHQLQATPTPGANNSDRLSMQHGTFVAGLLAAARDSDVPGICPGCTFISVPLLREPVSSARRSPATSEDLACAIHDCVMAGAAVINLSGSLEWPSPEGQEAVEHALDLAFHRGTIIVAAAGNRGSVGSSIITRHPAVIPVVAVDRNVKPASGTNLAASVGRCGLSAPGANVYGLSPGGKSVTWSGTSAATPFVTGAAALLYSIFPHSSPRAIKAALTLRVNARTSQSLIPPMLDADAAYLRLAEIVDG